MHLFERNGEGKRKKVMLVVKEENIVLIDFRLFESLGPDMHVLILESSLSTLPDSSSTPLESQKKKKVSQFENEVVQVCTIQEIDQGKRREFGVGPGALATNVLSNFQSIPSNSPFWFGLFELLKLIWRREKHCSFDLLEGEGEAGERQKTALLSKRLALGKSLSRKTPQRKQGATFCEASCRKLASEERTLICKAFEKI